MSAGTRDLNQAGFLLQPNLKKILEGEDAFQEINLHCCEDYSARRTR